MDGDSYGYENRDKVVNDKDYYKVCEVSIKTMIKRGQMPVNDYKMIKEFMS